MKTNFLKVALVSLVFASGGIAYAATCDSGTDCELPSSNGTQGSWSPTATQMSNIQAQNSVGPSGNIAGSRYYFAAASSDLGATVAKGGISTSGTGTQVVGAFSTASSGLNTSTVTGGLVQNLLGAQSYFFYAQACPSGASLDSAHCSLWARVGTHATSPYPTTVFGGIQQPTDATTNSIVVHTNVPSGESGSVSQISLEIDNLLTPAQNQVLTPFGWAGNTAYTIDSTKYTTGFSPNVKYQYKGTVTYPYGVNVPTGGAQVVGPFWTTPVNPAGVSATNVTHCSAQINAVNSGGAPGNPAYTPYNLCASGTNGGCLSGQIGNATPSTAISKTVVGLDPGTNYTPTATALVGNGADASANGWNNSATISGTSFTTLPYTLTTSISNITTTSAVYNISIGTPAGLTGYQVYLDGSPYGAAGSGVPPATVSITGLTPDSQHTVTIVLSEASCSSAQIGSKSFTTDAAAPTSFTMTANSPTQITAAWGANSNPAGITYHVQYCLDAGFTSSCATTDTTSLSAVLTGLTPETQYFGHVQALSVGGGQNSAFSNSANATTPNVAPVITSLNCPSSGPSSYTCTVTATDNAPVTNLLVHFAISPSAGVVLTPSTDQLANSGGSAQVVISLPDTQTYTVTATVTDHQGAGLSDSQSKTLGVTQIPTRVTIAPATASMQTGQTKEFDAVVYDQFTPAGVIANQHVNWAIDLGPGTAIAPVTNSSFTIFSPVAANHYTLTASLSGATPGTATIDVVAAGPVFTQNPKVVLNPDNKTALATALGTDNVSGASSIIYTWSMVSGPAPAAISPNGTNSAHDATITLSKAGTYSFKVVISNSNGSLPSTAPDLVVTQVLSGLNVCPDGFAGCPKTITLQTLAAQKFTASGLDQFNQSMAANGVAWTTNGGNGTSSGASYNFNAPATLGVVVRVTATQGTLQGTVAVNVLSFDVSGAHAYPVPYKSSMNFPGICFTGLGSQANLRIYTPSGHKVFEQALTPDNSQQCNFRWDLKNSSGEKVASGVYFFVVESPGGKKDGKLIIVQ